MAGLWKSALSRSSLGSITKRCMNQCMRMSTASEVEKVKEKGGEILSDAPLETNVPFAKNLFLGEFDKAMMVYPEIENNEELEELNQMVAQLEKYFIDGIDHEKIDRDAHIPDEVLQDLKDLGLFGQQIPTEYGGLGLNATKFARLAEVTSYDGAIAVTLAAHQSIGLKGILIDGNEQQKQKYLPKLATGEHIAAFCLTEPSSGSDAASIQTKATLSEDGKHFFLNGGKIWISNGGIADIFTVFAKTPIKDKDGTTKEKVTAFIVERAFGGISNGQPEDKLGIRGSNTCEVHFDNVPVPVENVLGQVGGGFKIAMNILNSGRFSMGSSGAGAVKRLITMVTEHATTRQQFGSPISDFGLIKEKIARLTLHAYVMESMAYHTAGVIDQYSKPDVSVEAAMVKIFSSEAIWDCVNEGLQILGGLGYMKAYPYERFLRDSRILLIFEGTNEILRMFIALSCMQHAGLQLKEDVEKLANPFMNVGFIFKKGIERMNKSNPSLKHNLGQEVHPNFRDSAGEMEKRVLKLRFMVEKYLATYKRDIINEQLALKRFADIAIDIFAMTAVISRASRSICIGLRNHDHEGEMALQFCQEALKRIDKNYHELDLDKHVNGDVGLLKIADTIIKNKGWAAEHPLTKNW